MSELKAGDRVRIRCEHREDCNWDGRTGTVTALSYASVYRVSVEGIGESGFTRRSLTLVEDELSPMEKLEAAIRVAAEAYDRAIYNAQQADKTLEAVKERLNHLEQAKATLESL